MKSASSSATTWAQGAANASGRYVSGAQGTTKDQSALAIAGKNNWQAGLQAAFAAGSYEKGLSSSGKSGWLAGITSKGAQNYATGVTTSQAQSKYATNSGKYDSARGAASSIARGPKGSAGNLSRVAAVVNAERAAKVGK